MLCPIPIGNMKTTALTSLSIGVALALFAPNVGAQGGPPVWNGGMTPPATAPAPEAAAPDNRTVLPQLDSEGEEGDSAYTNSRLESLQQGDNGVDWLYGSEIYGGVTPHEVDSLPHISASQERGQAGENTLTWVGFQPFETHTRVFIQTGRPAQYQVQESPDGLTLTVRLRDTRVDFSNFRRWIDASYFGRPVHMIDTERAADGVTEVSIELSRYADYTVSSDGGYLFIDFAE